MPRISIITVVYNSVDFIEKTIISILSQTYNNIEYLIIDGGSTDGTLDIIKKYADKIDFWMSEPDKGLYDAMNKGLRHANGEYVWFINSGDEIYDKTTVEKIFAEKSYDFADVYYGETIIIDNKGNEIGMRRLNTPDKLTWKSLKLGMRVSHQAFLAKKNITPEYDLKYRFSADFDWMIKVLKKARKIENTEMIIAKFLDGGLTKSNIVPGLKERFAIMVKNYGLISTIINHIYLGVKFLWFVAIHRRF